MTASRLPVLATTLLEREPELRAIDASLEAAAHGDGQLLVIEGEAGIGKSSLLHRAMRAASEAGFRAVSGRGSELERDYPYGVVTALFEPLLHDPDLPRAELLAGHAELAAPILVPSHRSDDTPDPFAIVHGLYWVALNAAESAPLLLAVDDAHWADEASLRYLHYVAQRLDGAPVAVIATFRPVDIVEESQAQRLLRHHPSAVTLTPSRLTEEAVRELLSRQPAGVVSSDVAHACWEATQGNPFFVGELAREVGVAQLSEAVGAGRPLETVIPERVARTIQARLDLLGADEASLAEAIAVLDTEANLHRATALAGIAEDAGAALVRRLTEVSILAPSDGVSFIHPIVRAAVYGRIPGATLGDAHRRAAWLLADDGAPPEAIAVQLLSAATAADPRVVEVLMHAARAAMAQGDPQVAAKYLARALSEPPARERTADVLRALARAEAALRADTAIAHYREALELLTDGRDRADLLLELGHAQIAAGQWSEAAETFESGLRLLGDGTDELASQLEAGFVSAAWVSMTRRGEAERRLGRILASDTLDPAQRELVTWIAYQRTTEVSASAAEVLALLRRALDDVPMNELVRAGQVVEVAAGVLLPGDIEADVRFLTDALAEVQRSTAPAKFAVYSYCRAWPHYYSGRLTDAIADAQAALDSAELGWETFFPATCAVLALAQLERGEIDAASTTVDIGEEWAQRIDYGILIPLARGRIALARGEAAAACEQFDASARVCEAMAVKSPVMADWRTWKAVALARLGEREEAGRVAAEGLEIARRWGAPWPLGVALRVAGIAEGGDQGLAVLEQAVTVLEQTPVDLERARAIIDFGAALRRAGLLTRARSELARGMDLAHRIGASALVETARQELLAAGARPRRYALVGPSALTPAELRVARMAATERTNREIAQALFVTPKAVEYHLANAYRKLGISSRRELGESLASEAAEGVA